MAEDNKSGLPGHESTIDEWAESEAGKKFIAEAAEAEAEAEAKAEADKKAAAKAPKADEKKFTES